MNSLSSFILHLSLIEGIGPVTIQKIISNLNEDCYHFSVSDWVKKAHLSPTIAQKLVIGLQDTHLFEKELALIEKHAIRWTTILEDDYPSLLKHIYAPPPVIYWKGVELQNDQLHLAIVGSRKANGYAQQVIADIIPSLVAANMVLVSGGAIGADTMVHQETVRNNGKTVVVLGSGLLSLYPTQNKKLFQEVQEKEGTLLSIFPLQTAPIAGNFPARNRIIAGISRGCIVVQAAAQSGASITANFALENGREVFAVPGSIYDELSVGCHNLIKQGAKIVSGAQDILEEYNIFTVAPPNVMVSVQKQVQHVAPKVQAINTPDLEKYTPVEQQIIQLCKEGVSIDQLLEVTKIELSSLQMLLFELQLDQIIYQDVAGIWQANV